MKAAFIRNEVFLGLGGGGDVRNEVFFWFVFFSFSFLLQKFAMKFFRVEVRNEVFLGRSSQ